MRLQLPLQLTLAAALSIALLASAPHAGATPAPTTTTLAITSGGSAVTTVTSGTVVTLTATVLAGTAPVTVGQVKFCDASATYCEDIHIVGTAQLTSAGSATYKFRPGVGSHGYKAVFVGTPNGATAYAASTSSAAALSVTGFSPSITTIAAGPSGNAYTLTATVGGNGSSAPTGTVSFLNASNDNAVLGTATLGAGTAGTSFLNVTNADIFLESIPSPASIAVGDFNGDGIPDLAVVNTNDVGAVGTVTILLGNGDGTFTTKSTPQTGIVPVYVAVGDFNGDGVLDLAVANSNAGSAGSVTILLGNGDGTFTATATSPATGVDPLSIAVGDFNGNGIPDLAVVSQGSGESPSTVTILLGNGDGTFTPAPSAGVGVDPTSIAVGDFNGDGILDLAVSNLCGYDGQCNSPSDVTILLGNGDGTFTAQPLETDYGAFMVVAADFNGDGITDLAVADDGVTVFLSNGDGNFTAEPSAAVGYYPGSIAVGDFNGDGIPDLVLAGAPLTELRGNGDGTFSTEATFPSVGSDLAIAAADFNGDGVPDVAVSTSEFLTYDFNDGAVQVFLAANYTATATDTVALPSGTEIYQVLASYPGDNNSSASISDAAWAPVAPTVTVTPSSSSITTAQSLKVEVSISGPSGYPNPTGWVDGVKWSGVGNIEYTIPAGALQIGNDTLTAGYDPDASSSIYYANASGTSTVVVTLFTTITPTVTVTPSSSSITTAQALTVTVAVSSPSGNPTPTGSVTLTSIGYASAAATLSSGSAQINIPAGSLETGRDFLKVEYTPDASSSADYNSASGTGTVVVTAAALTTPTVTVTPSSSSIPTTQALGVNISVSGPSGDSAPTGSVSLTSGSYKSGNITLSGGNATINIPAGSLATGSDTLTVNYTPDASSSVIYTSASGKSTVAVTLATPAVAVTPASFNITAFQTLIVTVSLNGPAGGPVPTGAVKLTSGSYTSSDATLSSGTASITIPAGALSLGADALTASYTPDSTSSTLYAGTAGSSSVTVSTVTPSVLVSPASRSHFVSQALSVAVAVSGPSVGPTPTGSVTLTGGSYNSGAVSLNSGSTTINIPAKSLSTGTDTLIAVYTPDSGSPGYSSASGASTVNVISFTPTVTVTPLATSILTSQALQVNVGVSGPLGDPTPTGSVDLTSGSYDSGAITLSSGSAAINVPGNSLGAGTDTLSVSYVPDSASSATYSSAAGSSPVTVTAPNASPTVGSMSPAFQTAGDDAFTLTVNGAGFISGSTVYWGTTALTTQFVSAAQITALVPASEIASSGTDSITVESPMPGGGTSNTLQFEVDSSGSGSPSLTTNKATVTAGQSATYAVTLPSAPSAVTASCLNLPTGASCSYSSTTSTMTIATSTTTPAGTYQVTMVFTETVAGAASAFIFLPILMLPLVRARRKWTAGKIWFTACLGLVLLVASAGIGCGGGGTSSTQPPPSTHQITTSAVVTLTVQ